jgi:hypothetical protein
MRRLLIILGIVVILAGVGAVLYFVFLGPSAPHLTVTSTPFEGGTTATVSNPVTGSNGSQPNQIAGSAGTVVAPNLIEVTTSAVSGGEVAFDIAPATTTTQLGSTTSTVTQQGDIEVHYIDRASGNVYAYRAHARSLTRISDKTLPGIQQASWLPDGSMALVRFLTDNNGTEELDTYTLPANGNGGYFLQSGLDEAVVTGSSTIFTLAASTDNSVGTLENAAGTNPQQIFTSALSSIIVKAAGRAFIAVTKAASEVDGYAFTINANGAFTPILGPLRGLTILPSPSGSQVLFSYTDGTSFHMGVLNLINGSITSLPIATIAGNKCVWASNNVTIYCGVPINFTGNLPDDWYQGADPFTDRLWRIDLSTRLATLVIDPLQSGKVHLDMVNLAIDPQSEVLVFRNKTDSSLWVYSLSH